MKERSEDYNAKRSEGKVTEQGGKKIGHGRLQNKEKGMKGELQTKEKGRPGKGKK